MIVSFDQVCKVRPGGKRTGVDLLVGEALGLVVALEGALGLVHESRHRDLCWWVGRVLGSLVICVVDERDSWILEGLQLLPIYGLKDIS
jgi:hypothetical protein